MKYETSVVYLEQVPKILVDSGFDWATFWSFSATVAIFVLGTYLTIRNFSKTIVSQEKVALENFELQRQIIEIQKVSASQNFELQKELIASQERAAKKNFEIQKEMIASQEVVAAQASLKTSRQNWINDLRDACAIYIAAALNVQRLNLYREAAEPWVSGDAPLRDWSFSHIQAMKELVSLKAKIELLVNPSEPESEKLLSLITELHDECDQADGPAKSICERVVVSCQVILKKEWEKAKSGK